MNYNKENIGYFFSNGSLESLNDAKCEKPNEESAGSF